MADQLSFGLMQTSEARPSVKLAVRIFLLVCALIFAASAKTGFTPVLVVSRIVLWLVVLLGYMSVAVWIWKDGLIALAEKTQRRRVGWTGFITNWITVVTAFKLGWTYLAWAYGILLVLGFCLRLASREKVLSGGSVKP